MIIPGSAPLERLRFFVLTRSGEARELGYELSSGLAPTTAVPKRVTSAGRSFRVSSGGTYGQIESAAPEKHTYSLELPAQAAAGSTGSRSEPGHRSLRTRSASLTTRGEWIRTIAFKTLDRGQRSVWVQVGACSQWHGFRGNRLYLESAADQQISEVRLVP